MLLRIFPRKTAQQEAELAVNVRAELRANEHVEERIENAVRVSQGVGKHLYQVHGVVVGKAGVEHHLPYANDVRGQPCQCERDAHERNEYENLELLLADSVCRLRRLMLIGEILMIRRRRPLYFTRLDRARRL
jgi:hypothetical protein